MPNIGTKTAVTASGSNIYVSYYEEDSSGRALMARSTNAGVSFSDIDVSESNPSAPGETDIATVNGRVFMTYGHQSNGAVILAISEDGGQSVRNINVETGLTGLQDTGVATTDSAIAIVYYDSNGNLRMARSLLDNVAF